jgi:mercuric reductase
MGQLDKAYDLVIVGSGGAAYGAAIEARRRDARVAMVEGGTVGGTCVNVGCIPSKTLLAGARAFHTAASHPFAGLPTQTGPVDLAGLVVQKAHLVADMRQHKYSDLAKAYDVEIVHGVATFENPTTLTVDGRELAAGAYLIATGAKPAIPPLPGLREAGYLTSTIAMEQTTVPERLVTIGGGFVGLELSQLFARLGAQVTIFGRLAPRTEPELAARLRRILADEGIQVVNARATAVEHQSDTRVVHTDRHSSVEGDAILVATGHRARVEFLDLAAARCRARRPRLHHRRRQPPHHQPRCVRGRGRRRRPAVRVRRRRPGSPRRPQRAARPARHHRLHRPAERGLHRPADRVRGHDRGRGGRRRPRLRLPDPGARQRPPRARQP